MAVFGITLDNGLVYRMGFQANKEDNSPEIRIVAELSRALPMCPLERLFSKLRNLSV
jgi:hypothetical protein